LAEFCLDCWNKLNEISLTTDDVIISKDLYLCEGCGKMKNIIEIYERKNLIKKFIQKIIRK